MTIQDLGSISEVVGAAATVATLLYLAVQIRQNTRTVRAAGASDVLNQQSAIPLLLGQDEKAAKLYFDGLAGAELSETEARQFEMLVGVWMNNFTQSRILEQEGLLNRQLAANHLATTEWLISQPGFERYWSAWQQSATPEVVALVQSIRKKRAQPAAQERAAADLA